MNLCKLCNPFRTIRMNKRRLETIKFTLTDTMNTYNHSLMLIKSKGYKIFFYPNESEELFGDFYAINKDKRFIASDPLRLLGLITISENYGCKWQEQEKFEYEDLYNQILDLALPNELSDIEKLTSEEFKKLTKHYKIFFHSLNIEFNENNITKKSFYNLINNFYKEKYENK